MVSNSTGKVFTLVCRFSPVTPTGCTFTGIAYMISMVDISETGTAYPL